MKNYLKIAAIVALALTSLTMTARHVSAADDDQVSFTVRNHNVQRITGLLVSEDGKHWGKFDIGKGIDVGQTMKLDWDKSTNSMGCMWFIKAVYKDKSVGEAVKFDFCDENVVIDF